MPTPHAPQTRSADSVAGVATRWPAPHVDVAWHSRLVVAMGGLDSNSDAVQTLLCAHTRSVTGWCGRHHFKLGALACVPRRVHRAAMPRLPLVRPGRAGRARAGPGGGVSAIASPVPQKVCGVHAVAPLPPPLLYVSLGHGVHRASSRVISVPLPGTRHRADGQRLVMRDAGPGALQIRVSHLLIVIIPSGAVPKGRVGRRAHASHEGGMWGGHGALVGRGSAG